MTELWNLWSQFPLSRNAWFPLLLVAWLIPPILGLAAASHNCNFWGSLVFWLHFLMLPQIHVIDSFFFLISYHGFCWEVKSSLIRQDMLVILSSSKASNKVTELHDSNIFPYLQFWRKSKFQKNPKNVSDGVTSMKIKRPTIGASNFHLQCAAIKEWLS